MSWGRVRSFANASRWALVHVRAPDTQASFKGTTWSCVGRSVYHPESTDKPTHNVQIAGQVGGNIVVRRYPVSGGRCTVAANNDVGSVTLQNGCIQYTVSNKTIAEKRVDWRTLSGVAGSGDYWENDRGLLLLQTETEDEALTGDPMVEKIAVICRWVRLGLDSH